MDCGETTHLDTYTSSHLVRVLRTKKGSPVILFNGDGFDYYCQTLDTNAKKTLISIESKKETKNESNLDITLIQGLSRHDRMEATIQKSVELGVNKVIPVLCQRSNTKLTQDKQDKKLEHWRKVAISACEQSGRSRIPEVTEITSLSNIDHLLKQNAFKITLNPDSNTSLNDTSFSHTSIEVFIGPEGGLNDDEIILLENRKFENICFGPRILRTETAGPAVISALQILWGDF
jgi:16S rRNA (uracil1498-N3)-methyltransferase